MPYRYFTASQSSNLKIIRHGIVTLAATVLSSAICVADQPPLSLNSSEQTSVDTLLSTSAESLHLTQLAFANATPLSLAIGQAQSQPNQEPQIDSGRRLRSWELPPVTVVGESPAALKEEELVGSYRQPRWTATRRFPTTRVYVIPEGKVEVEGWARGTFEDGESEWRFLQEIEVGLGYRLQLDLYLRQDYDTESDNTAWGEQIEIRWALADWGEIWGNPTLYFEYIFLDEGRPDKIEPKLLLGDELAEGWHWAVNFVAEIELGGEKEHEYQITSGLSYSVIDSVFSVGVENIFTFADVEDDRGDFTTKFVIGPSFQWRPVPAMTINIAPLIGIGEDSPDAQLWFNIGWEF